MQLWAIDRSLNQENKIYVEDAFASKNYFCLECSLPLRVRVSPLGLRHFFHISTSPHCSQAGRSALHIQVQRHIVKGLPPGEAEEEVRFPEISRVADVAYYPKKCIFEVQCSWIDKESALERTLAYQSIGWNVVWLLSYARFGRRNASSFEEWLLGRPHYFFDSKRDHICFFDLPSHISDGRRLSDPLFRSNLVFPLSVAPVAKRPVSSEILQYRMNSWPLRLRGDLFERVDEGLGQFRAAADKKGFRLHAVNKNPVPLGLRYLELKQFILRCLQRLFKRFF